MLSRRQIAVGSFRPGHKSLKFQGNFQLFVILQSHVRFIHVRAGMWFIQIAEICALRFRKYFELILEPWTLGQSSPVLSDVAKAQ